MKRIAACLLTVCLLLSGCGVAGQATETKGAIQAAPDVAENTHIPEQMEMPTIPEETDASTDAVQNVPETQPQEEAVPVQTEPQQPNPEIPNPTESRPDEPKPAPTEPKPAPTEPKSAPTEPKPAPTEPKPAPTEPKPAPTDPAPTEPKPTESKPAPTTPAPTEPAKSQNTKPTNRPTSSATCRDTGSDKIWEDPRRNQKDYYEETDPERTDYLEYLKKEGNPYFFWIQEEDMRMYLGRTYGIPLYTSYDFLMECTWVSSDPSIATVNQVGYVVPLKVGEIQVTVYHVDPETQESSSRVCQIRVEEKPVYTFAQMEERARKEAKEIAEYIDSFSLNSDLERIAAAATVINTYVEKGIYSSAVPGYNQPFGTLVSGFSSCAGSTRALGLVLEYMGYSWYHMGENQWSHQWCVVYDVDGQTAFADGSAYGIAGYGERQEDGSNWMCYRYGSLQPFQK